MTIKPTADLGQSLGPPAGKVIGFIDGQAEFEAFAIAVRAAGYPEAKITALYGDDGLQLLERLKTNSFFFGDSEDSIIQLSIRKLKQGHYAAAVDVTDHEQAVQIASLAKPHARRAISNSTSCFCCLSKFHRAKSWFISIRSSGASTSDLSHLAAAWV